MLSKILSRAFAVAFLFLLLASMVQLVVQLRQKPVTLYKSANRSFTIGNPGIELRAMKSYIKERLAPDTTVIYKSLNSQGALVSGTASWNDNIPGSKKYIDSLVRLWEERKDSVKIDMLISTIRNTTWQSSSMKEGTVTSTGYKKLGDGRVLSETSTSGNSGKPLRDTFSNMAEAQLSQFGVASKTEHHFVESGFTEEILWLKPIKLWERILFTAYQEAILFFLCWLFFTLSRLFRNFSRNDFFSPKNIRLLRNTGICLLLPQLLMGVFYWGYSYRLHPVKFLLKGSEEAEQVASYQFISETNWLFIFIGFGLLVLSYIFKNGLVLKEDQASII